MGLSTPRNELACTYNGCGQQRYKTLTYVAKTQPFGGGELCPTEDSNYEFTRIEEQGCSTESRCCEDSDYVTGECNNEGINSYTLDTTYCDNSDTQIPVSKDVDCCYVGNWDDGVCNLDDRPGYKKYTRNVPNVGACTSGQLGEYETGYPNVKYTRDANACDKDCVIGALNFTDKNPDNSQIILKGTNYWSHAQKVSYAGSTPAEGLGDNWCATWEDAIRSCPSCSDTTNVDGVIMTSSAGLVPLNTDIPRDKVDTKLGLNWGGSNYWRCGGSGPNQSNMSPLGSDCGDGNARPAWYR